MTLGEELRALAKLKKDEHEKILEEVIPTIEKKVRQRAEAGFFNVVMPLRFKSDSEWQVVVDWAIDNEIGCKIEDEKKKLYRFMW